MQARRRKGTVVAPSFGQLAAISEDSDDVKDIDGSTSQDNRNDVQKKVSESDFSEVVHTAKKLKLNTQRPSVVAWKAQHLGRPPRLPGVSPDTGQDGKLTPERKTRINQALDWIKNELLELRREDQSLARQLLGIRRDISRLRLSRSCEEHEDMLEDALIDMEEIHDLRRVLDIPYECLLPPDPLKQLGVTKMNISIRRFSTC